MPTRAGNGEPEGKGVVMLGAIARGLCGHLLSWLRPERGTCVALFLLVALPYFASTVGVMNSMDGPQYALARALVERHAVFIEGYPYVLPDAAVVGSHGYVKRNPGVSFLAAPLFAISGWLRPVLVAPYGGAEREGIDENSAEEAMTYGLYSLVGALGVVCYFLVLRTSGVSTAVAFGAALLFGFGSLLWEYAPSLVREPTIIALLFLGLLQALRLARASTDASRWRGAAVVGGTAGLCIVFDNAAAVPAAVLALFGAYCVFGLRIQVVAKRRLVAWLVGGALVGMLPLLAYNVHVYGKPLVNGYEYDVRQAMRDPQLYQLADPRWSIPTILFSVGRIAPEALPYLASEPEWARLNSASKALEHAFKGLLMQSPVLLLAAGYAVWWTLTRPREQPLCTVALLMGGATLLSLSRISVFYHPNNWDTRYFLIVAACLFLPLGPVLESIRRQVSTDASGWIALRWGAVLMLLGVMSVQNGWFAVLANYRPHISGEGRANPALIMSGADPWSSKVAHLAIETFPNYANLPLLLALLAAGFGLAEAIRWRRGRPAPIGAAN